MNLSKEFPNDPTVQEREAAIRRAERFCLFLAGAGFMALLMILIRVAQACGA